MKVRAAALLVIIVAVATAWAVSARERPRPVTQPIAFSHKRHLEEEITCKDCHKYAEDGRYATLPPTKACLLCHEEEQGKHPDEPKVREHAKDGGEIPWAQVNRLVGHVYFSHAAHVKHAGMDCAECHGDMREMTEPVTLPQIGHLDMDRCMSCHEAKGASNDCVACHK
ncbi:MAG: cytochrome c3 family protein [Planctomycetes bacterium]|nr:cytochrome c3 family protein [Planctomycetota bacterium]